MKNVFIFGLIVILIGGSFLPIINSKTINNGEEYENDKQLVYQITYQEVREVIEVERKNDDIDVESYYEPLKFLPINSMENNGYIIITDDDLKNAVISSDFIDWKTSIGYNVIIVSITDTEINNQPGVDLAEQIRNFLRQYYTEWSIKYVLFVGNYERIPMRYCYPDPTNHRFEPFDMFSGEIPTDYYYADLSTSDAESWDSDGDGFHGEFRDDEPNFEAEISVGRIPTNDITRVTYTLDKFVSFEQNTGSWKKNALNAGAFFYFTNQDGGGTNAMDGATLSYHIEEDLMTDWTVSHYSEQEGLETSVYDWPALNEESFISDWRNNQYSVVNWQGHGWTSRVAQCIWSTDDGDDIPEGSEFSWPDFISVDSELDDDYPSVVTAVSCYVGCPEIEQGRNLGVDLLINPLIGASVGVIASARSPYGSYDWSPTNPGGSDSIIYELNKNIIINNQRVGDALYNSKLYCTTNFGWNSYLEYLDLYTFNLYGDPSLVLQGVNVEGKPDKPTTPSGPSNGNSGEEYTYTTFTTDPDGDQIYYMWDWGDETFSEWLGPYGSGEECLESHIWNDVEDYNIKVKAKDTNHIQSPWSDPLPVSIPKNKVINGLFQNFMGRHPHIFFILEPLLQRMGQ